MLDRFSSDSSRYSALVGAFRAYATPVIAILGLIGNSLIISIFWNENPSRTRFSIFATSLAVVHNVSLLLNTILDDFLGRGLDYATNVLVLNGIIILRLWRAQRWRKAVSRRWGGVQELGRIAGHLVMSSCFLLLYLPLGIIVLMRLHITVTLGEVYTPRGIQIVNLSKFFSSLKDVAYAVNCLIYATFLPKFRTKLMHRLHIK
ncbi:unnamed protein product [Rodentolepis nana]|uniref:G_PROTEIN_RECEP_F1_2 domain-containing protein n=1 Tax=Rodentolepis nana TaxID=102285 RepID=A0A0R3TNN2_RODNA|nr:unnamed protein product [Rodentolepis nana]